MLMISAYFGMCMREIRAYEVLYQVFAMRPMCGEGIVRLTYYHVL